MQGRYRLRILAFFAFRPVLPEPGQPRQVGRAQGRGFMGPLDDHRDAENIR